MAGDWIKMRGALLDHPKVVAIARSLHRNKDFREWMTPGGSGASNGQIISNSALRCVTTALLMRLWSVSREHGHFVGDDLVLEHSEISDLDQMAGAPGVGEAMLSVRWAIEENGVTLPNFKEFNVPMTSAEKQKEYRNRNAKGNAVVTKSLPSDSNENPENVTSREEKRRKEIKAPDFVLPDWVPAEPWSAWIEVRKLKKAANTSRALTAALESLDALRRQGENPTAVLNAAVIGSWKSLHAVRKSGAPPEIRVDA